MAISFGDAALAFAGGAAKQYNKMADEERKVKADRQKRVQELLDQVAVKQAETEYSTAMKNHEDDLALDRTLKGIRGGARSGMGQLAIAERLGLDQAAFLKSSDFGYLTFNGVGKAPIPFTERMMEYLGDEFTPEQKAFAQRYRSKYEGKTYTKKGEGIPRGIATDENGNYTPRDLIGGVGLGEDDPAWMVGQPPQDEEGYASYMRDFSRQLRGEKPEQQWINAGDGFIYLGTLPEPGTGGKPTLELMAEPEKGSGFSPESQIGKEAYDLDQLIGLAADNPDRWAEPLARFQENMKANPNLQVIQGTTTVDGVSYDTVQLYEKTEKGMTPVGQEFKVGQKTEQETVNSRLQTQITEYVDRTAKASEVQDAIVQRMHMFTSAETNIPGAITSTVAYFKNNISGFMELAGVKRETMLDQLNALKLEHGGDMEAVVTNMKEGNDYLKSMSDQDLEWLAYSMANVLKDVGDTRATSKYDIEQGASMVKRLFSTEGGLAAASTLYHKLDVRSAQAHQLTYQNPGANDNQRETAGHRLVKKMNRDIPDNQIVYSPHTKKTYVFSSQEHRAQFEKEMKEQNLLLKPFDKVLDQFPEELRPVALDDYIKASPNGWLIPDFDQAYYYELFSTPR